MSTLFPTQSGEGPNGISLALGQTRYQRNKRAHSDAPPNLVAREPRDDEPRDREWKPYSAT
jgi:hypothetical protein